MRTILVCAAVLGLAACSRKQPKPDADSSDHSRLAREDPAVGRVVVIESGAAGSTATSVVRRGRSTSS